MPSYVKNTGMSSSNELFAMKKNLAYETKFEHQLSGITRDYFNKKENLRQDIRAVYNELKDIKTSTGYSLDQAKSITNDNRRPTMPTIYLPPIGIRLVKKYVGIDVKRQSLVGNVSPDGQQPNLESILNQTIGISRPLDKPVIDIPKVIDLHATRKFEFLEDSDNQVRRKNQGSYLKVCHNEDLTEEITAEKDKPNSITTPKNMVGPLTEDCKQSLPFVLTREEPLHETLIVKQTSNFETKSEEACNVEEELNEWKVDDNAEKTLLIDARYNLTERRSSRSTFRGRSSTRLLSRSSMLSEYNLGVIALSQKKINKSNEKKSVTQVKEKTNIFYIDYGDGKLHDSMEIPKIKDCSRPWCNPHCKTCRNRTFSRPCFVLIPADENIRKRKLPLDKRRLSSFPVHSFATVNKTNPKDRSSEIVQSIKKETTALSEEECVDKAFNTENTNLAENEEGDKNIVDENRQQTDPNIEQLMPERVTTRKKGYSKNRMEELSQPRGGPPAEVRFSKMSLRRQQEALIADERRKALTEFERENLANIQGKISMFLALLNEKEIMGKPVKMVDIPMRMDVDLKHNKKTKKKRHRNVHFNQRARLLS